MGELIYETILGAMISELPLMTGASITEFLAKYETLFARYVDYIKLKQLLEESEPAENWGIICKAKELALGDCMEGSNHSHPLCSIFSNLSLRGKYPTKMYYETAALNMKSTIPCCENKNFDCQKLMNDFSKELEMLMCSSPKEFDSFLVVMDTLLKKYFWCIPASGKQFEDVSLYEYIRTTTAITAALMKAGQKDVPFVMAAGHFSGIQNYIFSVSKVGTGGVAKRLRARSFYVNAMVSALAHCILHKSGLPMVNILMLTGGKFYLLLPNTDDIDNLLNKVEQQVSVFLYEKFKGNLSMELVWEKVTDNDIRIYSNTIVMLSKKINGKKNRLLESILISGEEWQTERFVVYQDLTHKSMCSSCRSALVESDQNMCPNCEVDTEIGGRLPKIRMFSFSRKRGQYKLLDDYYLNLEIDAGGEENYLIMLLNDLEMNGMYNKPVTAYYGVNHVPTKEHGQVKTFGEIADEATGSKKLGILKADVDTLGFLFSEGLQDDSGDAVSISRVNTLSHMLELFFGGCLQDLIINRYQNVYCVFSGGDDLFFIGPWNEMPALAIDINEKFHTYTGNNECMTLSAAICIAESGGHISTLAEYCEEKLKQVKKKADEKISSNKQGRNGVYFLGKVMSWEDFKEQIDCGRKFADAITNTGSSMIKRLANYSSMYQEYLTNNDPNQLMFLPMFSYDMARNSESLKKDKWLQDYCKILYKNASDYYKTDKNFYYVEFCVKYALQLTKEVRKIE